MANFVLKASIEANKSIIAELIGNKYMFETLIKIMRSNLDEIHEKSKEESLREEHILETI